MEHGRGEVYERGVALLSFFFFSFNTPRFSEMYGMASLKYYSAKFRMGLGRRRWDDRTIGVFARVERVVRFLGRGWG